MDRFNQMILFIQIAERESLTRAADALGMSNASVSRQLAAIEERLGVRLVERSTRRLWITDAGRQYLRECVELVAAVQEAEAKIGAASVNPSGLVRLTCSVSFAMLHVANALPAFRDLFPDVAVQVITANRYLDFIEAGIDVAIRTRQREADSTVTMRTLARTELVTVAAPDYLARHGIPMVPDDLAEHDLLTYSLMDEPQLWRFRRGAETRPITVSSRLDSNEGQVIVAAAVAGLGVTAQPVYMVCNDIKSGRLVPLLTDWRLSPLVISIAYQSRRHQPARVRAFIEFMVDYFRNGQLEERWNSCLPREAQAGVRATTVRRNARRSSQRTRR